MKGIVNSVGYKKHYWRARVNTLHLSSKQSPSQLPPVADFRSACATRDRLDCPPPPALTGEMSYARNIEKLCTKAHLLPPLAPGDDPAITTKMGGAH